MKTRTEYRKKYRKRHNNKQRKFRKICVLAAAVALGIGVAIGGYWGHIQKENEKRLQAAAEELKKEQEQQEQEETTEIDLSLLQEKLEQMVESQDGTWSIYVKELETNASFSVNNQEMYAASLIKLFVMESSLQYMDMLLDNEASYLGSEQSAEESIKSELKKMIEQSDNDAYNNLVSLHSEDLDFKEGCYWVGEYLKEAGYQDTGIFHTLSPSETESESISDIRNHTSVEDCGRILEKIYNGTCISEEAFQIMLELLMNQENVEKIPQGVPQNITTANKTGETDDVQHDAAIVFGEKTDYILCIMSTGTEESGTAIKIIQDISSEVYNFLNN